jgi:hypothetical protein
VHEIVDQGERLLDSVSMSGRDRAAIGPRRSATARPRGEFICAHSGQSSAQLNARYQALSGLLAAAASDARMTVGLAAHRSGDSLGELIDRADQAMLADRRSS